MLNHSCQRCRSKKLRCDGEQPCSNCASKGLDHACLRPLRKERPRKKDITRQKTQQPTSISYRSHEGTHSPISSSGHASDNQLAPIVQTVAATSLGGNREHTTSSPLLQQSYPPPVPSSASSYARSKVSSVRKTLTGGPAVADNHTTTDNLITASGSQTTSQRSPAEQFTRADASMRAYRISQSQIIEARQLLGSVPAAIRILKYIWAWRCQSTSHSAVHVPTLKRVVRQVFDDEWAQEVTQDQLCLLLMSIAISIQFAPRKGPYAHVWKLVEGLGSTFSPEERQRKLHHLTRAMFEGRLQADSCTLEGIQTAMLFLLYDLDEEPFKEYLFEWAIRGAKSLRLDHIGPPSRGIPTVEMEMGTRVWWFLVCRDGLAGLNKATFSIDLQNFTTRVPMLIADEDLAHGRPSPRVVADSCTVAISLPLINLASVVRRLVEIRTRGDTVGQEFSDTVADAFDQYAEELPAIFSLGASAINVPTSGDDTSIYIRQRLETERWLLHQQIFHAYLQLYELRLDVKVCEQMVGLASHILHLQDKVRDRCMIVDGLRINVTGVLRAITVMTIDLLQKHKDSKVSLVRQLTLGKIHEAIRKTEETSTLAEGDLDNVKRLLEWEEMAWREKTKSSVPSNSFCLSNILSAPLPNMTRDSTSSLSPSSLDGMGGCMATSPASSFSSSMHRTAEVATSATSQGATSFGGSGSLNTGQYPSPIQMHQRHYLQDRGSETSFHGSGASGGSPSTMNDHMDSMSGSGTNNTTPAEDYGEKTKMGRSVGPQSSPSYILHHGRGPTSQGASVRSHASQESSLNPPSSGTAGQQSGQMHSQSATYNMHTPNMHQQHPSMSVHSMSGDYNSQSSRPRSHLVPPRHQQQNYQPQSQSQSQSQTQPYQQTQHQQYSHSPHSWSTGQPTNNVPTASISSSAPPPHSSTNGMSASNTRPGGVNLNLFPSDQAFSPLFAPGSQIGFQPTWEEICATFMDGGGGGQPVSIGRVI